MGNKISRRQLLRTGALLAGGLPIASSLLGKAQASPIYPAGNGITGTNILEPGSRGWVEQEIAMRAPAELKARLFANENPFGPSDKAKKAISEAMLKSYQYPFMYFKDLYQMIADHEGVKPENILFGAGSSPLLMAAAMYFSKPGGNIVTGDPSYEDLPTKASRFNEKWVKVPLTADYKLDLDAMEKAVDGNTGLVYVCNPNNPTATVVDTEKLRSFCERVSKRVTVFVDEAYIDYLPDPAGTTMISGVRAGQNIIVARTFSKLYGFAGLRVGYVMAQPDMIKKLEMYTEGPMSISATSLHAALASYQDKEYLQGALSKTLASREYLYDVLKKEGYTYIPSNANFVMFPLKMDGEHFAQEMMKRGVGVRSWTLGGSNQWCRISIGRMDEMEAFATAFKELS
jgi:histidinol-phosphate aminotransferase